MRVQIKAHRRSVSHSDFELDLGDFVTDPRMAVRLAREALRRGDLDGLFSAGENEDALEVHTIVIDTITAFDIDAFDTDAGTVRITAFDDPDEAGESSPPDPVARATGAATRAQTPVVPPRADKPSPSA